MQPQINSKIFEWGLKSFLFFGWIFPRVVYVPYKAVSWNKKEKMHDDFQQKDIHCTIPLEVKYIFRAIASQRRESVDHSICVRKVFIGREYFPYMSKLFSLAALFHPINSLEVWGKVGRFFSGPGNEFRVIGGSFKRSLFDPLRRLDDFESSRCISSGPA